MKISSTSRKTAICAAAAALPIAVIAVSASPAAAAPSAPADAPGAASSPTPSAGDQISVGPGFIVTNSIPSTCKVTHRDKLVGGGTIVCTNVGQNWAGSQIRVFLTLPGKVVDVSNDATSVNSVDAGRSDDVRTIHAGEAQTFAYGPAINASQLHQRAGKIVITVRNSSS